MVISDMKKNKERSRRESSRDAILCGGQGSVINGRFLNRDLKWGGGNKQCCSVEEEVLGKRRQEDTGHRGCDVLGISEGYHRYLYG